MKHRSIFALLVCLLVGAVAAAPAPAAKPDKSDKQPVYLAIGDSWAFGIGATVPAESGYVAQLADLLREDYKCVPAKCSDLQLLNLAVPGATTSTMISGQLPDAF